MMHLDRGLFLLLITLTSLNSAQESITSCTSAKSCGECLEINPDCGWCLTQNYETKDNNTRHFRCDIKSVLEENGCNVIDIVSPLSAITYVRDVELSSDEVESAELIQVKPQELSFTLRPKEVLKFTIRFRQAKDFPVDLYYVMDLSYSMNDDLENLKSLGTQLAREMSSITKDFRLGFGAFVDKKVMPYVNTVPERLLEPCTGCEPPFGFRNVLPLANASGSETDEFTQEINKQQISGNLDSPEGGLDALLQATVCTKEIGWRERARHLLVYTSDASFHLAGDGKLGGIVKPFDGECHLEDGEYSKSTELDYPSISQLNDKVKEHNIVPVFAVTASEIATYEQLEQLVDGSYAEQLADDSSNIVDLINDVYQQISSSVKLTDNSPDVVDIEYTSDCAGFTEEEKECTGIQFQDTVTFNITLTLKECATLTDDQKKFTISTVGTGLSDSITINIDNMLCDCNCENEDLTIPNHPDCTNGNGTLVCGGCVCNEGRAGPLCECDIEESEVEIDNKACILANTTKVCSGRGLCVCGECLCDSGGQFANQKIEGRYCECSNISCDSYKGEVCGGPERGQCVCDDQKHRSVCKCKPEYTRADCGCPSSKDACIAANGLECNGFGVCDCGQCNCNATSGYRGNTCEVCPTCSSCTNNKPCVLCTAFGTGKKTEEECLECPYQVIMVDKVPQADDARFQDTRLCYETDESDDCSAIFLYAQLLNGTYVLYVEREKTCPSAVNPLFIVLGVVLGILFIGLALLLMWKLLTTIHDRREFEKFEKERAKAKWDSGENPIYKPTTSTYKNPMYAGNKTSY